MKKYIFENGDEVVTKLEKEEMVKRMKRLDMLMALVECRSDEAYASIYNKASKAFYKYEFTGIIRLTGYEKEMLSYLLENDMMGEEDVEVIEYYVK